MENYGELGEEKKTFLGSEKALILTYRELPLNQIYETSFEYESLADSRKASGNKHKSTNCLVITVCRRIRDEVIISSQPPKCSSAIQK